MKRIIFLIYALILMLSNGCTYSVKEMTIRNKRPAHLKNHHCGMISPLSEQDIQEAIDFGKENRHNEDTITYAFLYSKDVSELLSNYSSKIYIVIETNYYLISKYVSLQSRKYEDIDYAYVNFLSKLPTFRINVFRQISYMLQTISVTRCDFVLMKNGEKISQSRNIQTFNGKNPYSTFFELNDLINDVIKQNLAISNAIAKSYGSDEETKYDKLFPLTDVYNYSDIDLDSTFEVIVIYKDREIRIPVDFSIIK